MKNQKQNNKLAYFFKELSRKLFRIDDSPQKIAQGFGVGVFLGILPGTGPAAAIFCALFLKVNRASALAGSLLTNTWLSFVTFVLSIKIGSVILNVDWKSVPLEVSAKTILVLTLGYFVIGVCAGLTAYLIALLLLKGRRHEDKSRVNLSG